MSNLRLGMIGLDTSHCGAFTNLLNNENDPYHVAGGRVVAAYPGGSAQFALSRDRVGQFTEQMREKFGVKIMDSIAAVAKDVDAIFLESVDGRQHLEQFAILAPFGKPVFIDKPFATSVADAKALLDLSERYGTPIYSCSSIRYAQGIAELGKGKQVLGCETFGPNAILDDFPGLFWYGIHSAEVLFAKMGRGCVQVTTVKSNKADAVVGIWQDGRVGTLYGYRLQGVSAFGATVLTDGGVFQGTAQSKPPYYALMLPHILDFFHTGHSPVDPQETLEITAFLEAANQSRESGVPVAIEL